MLLTCTGRRSSRDTLAPSPRGDCMTREPDGLFRLRAGRGGAGALPEPLPVLFTLVAERPGPRGTLSEDEPVG